MSITQDVEELHAINSEIKRMNESMKKLRESKKVVEERVSSYLQRENLPAVTDKAKGLVVMLDSRQRKIFDKPKKERDIEAISILQAAGVSNASDIYTQLKDVGRGSVQSNVLKFNRLE